MGHLPETMSDTNLPDCQREVILDENMFPVSEVGRVYDETV